MSRRGRGGRAARVRNSLLLFGCALALVGVGLIARKDERSPATSGIVVVHGGPPVGSVVRALRIEAGVQIASAPAGGAEPDADSGNPGIWATPRRVRPARTARPNNYRRFSHDLHDELRARNRAVCICRQHLPGGGPDYKDFAALAGGGYVVGYDTLLDFYTASSQHAGKLVVAAGDVLSISATSEGGAAVLVRTSGGNDLVQKFDAAGHQVGATVDVFDLGTKTQYDDSKIVSCQRGIFHPLCAHRFVLRSLRHQRSPG